MSSSVLRRVTALIAALLLLQLTLAGGSVACITHGQGVDAPRNDHSAMSMDSSIGSASDKNHSGCPAHHTTGPCDSMAACGPVVLGAAIAGMSIVVIPATGAIPSRVLAPPTRTTAPELPPPRS